MKKSKIILKPTKNKEIVVAVKSPNNQTLVVSETYKKKQGAENLVKALKKVMKNPQVISKISIKKRK